MISTQIEIDSVEDVIPIIDWCEEYIGTKAPFKDCIDCDRPWGWDSKWGIMTFYFANHEDAAWFKLRWS